MSNNVYEIEVMGCHVRVERLSWQRDGKQQYASSVSYKFYNAKGVHVASPTWDKIGGRDETKAFILREVQRAQDHNKPILAGGLHGNCIYDGQG